MGALQEAVKQPTNLSIVSQVTLGKMRALEISKNDFLNPKSPQSFDPEVRKKQLAINMTFVHQAAPDICWHLQCQERFVGKQLV